MKRAILLLISLILLNLSPMIATADNGDEIEVYLEVPLSVDIEKADDIGYVITTCRTYCLEKTKDGAVIDAKLVTECEEVYPTKDNLQKDCDPEKDKLAKFSEGTIQKYGETTDQTDACKDLINENTKEIDVSCRKVQIVSGGSGIELLSNYVGLVYRWAATIVGMIAVVIIIVSGVQISMAGGETTGIEEAKKRIFQSIIGLIVLFLSALILYTINPDFFN